MKRERAAFKNKVHTRLKRQTAFLFSFFLVVLVRHSCDSLFGDHLFLRHAVHPRINGNGKMSGHMAHDGQ